MNIPWSRRRKVSLGFHLLFAFIPLGASTVSAFVWWSALFGSGWSAAGLIVTLEVLAITSLILHIGQVPWPLAWFRHTIPFLSIIPLGYELEQLLEPNGWGVAIPLAVAVTGWFIYLSHQLFTSMEALFIDPVEAAREQAIEQMRSLQVTLSSWEAASQAVQSFAGAVRSFNGQSTVTATAAAQITEVQPTMPLLQAAESSHPKMREIAMLAQIKAVDGTWALSTDVIQRQVRVAPETVKVLVALVRSGQVAFVDGEDNGNGNVNA